jgi:hypothetical protein
MSFLRSISMIRLLALILVDVILISIWVSNEDLPPDSAMGIYIVVPFVFLINLIVAGILYLFKNRYSYIFLINAVLSSIIMYNLFNYGMQRTIDSMYDSWEFSKNDTLFVIDKANKFNEFSISYITQPGSSTQYISGSTKSKGDTVSLLTGSTRMYIVNGMLYNFQGIKARIVLKVRN